MDCTLSPRQLSSPTSTAPEAVSTEPTARGALWAQRSRPPCPPNGHGRALDRTLGLGYRWCHWAYAYQGPERPHQRLGSCSPTLGPGEHRSTSSLTDPTGCVGQRLAAFKLTKADVWPGCPCRAQTPADPSSTMRRFFEKIMDLSLLIFTLEIHQFCMKCIEFTTRTYNFKNLAVGSLIWGTKTGVNSSYFPQKVSTCPVLCCILTRLAQSVDMQGPPSRPSMR